MPEQASAPLAGLLRVVFFLAVAAMGLTAAVTGVTTLYDAPEEEEPQFDEQFNEFEGLEGFDGFNTDVFAVEESEEKRDYDRNVGLILGLLGTAAIAAAVLALGSRYNPLRAGLLAGGAGLVLWGVATGVEASDDWLVFVTSGLALVTLVVCSLWLDEGLPPDALRQTGPSSGGGGAGAPWQGGSGSSPGPGGGVSG
jgi:hypothetical protein